MSYEFPPSGGGEAIYTRSLATAFSRAGHEVTLIIPGGRGPIETEEGVRVIPIGTRGPVRGARFLAGAERALDYVAGAARPDVVHVTFDYPTFLFHARRHGIPCVATVHHLHLVEAASLAGFGEGPWGRLQPFLRASVLTWLEGRLLSQCDSVLAVSRFTASSVERLLGVDPRRLGVVLNGIDQAPFGRGEAQAFREAFPSVREKAVLYVGRLSHSKGVDLLIEAFAKTRSRTPDSSLVLVGSGDPAFVGELKRRAASLEIAEDVVFTGRIPDSMLPHAYAAASLTVLPSHMEGFGLSVLESMASARPCVATRVGGIPEILADGKTGLLVRPGDADRLAGAIQALLADPGLARRMGQAGRELARDRFTLERMAQETMASYERTIGSATDMGPKTGSS